MLNKDKRARPGWGAIDRRGQVLFINARRSFERLSKSGARRLGDAHTERILTTLAAWRGITDDGAVPTPHRDEPGWSRSCSAKDIADHRHDLMPTSYAVEPPGPERDTRSRIDQLKHELVEKLNQAHDLESRLLEALKEF